MTLTLWQKILLIAAGVLIVSLSGIIIYQQIALNKQQAAMQSQITAQKQLIDQITRSSSTWANKDDIAKLVEANGVNATALKAIQNDMSSIKSSLTAANVITVNSQGQTGSNLPSSSTGNTNPQPIPTTTVNCPSGGTVACPNADPFGYQAKAQNLDLNENFGTLKVPFGTATFSAWQQNPWSVNIAPREYQVANVIGTDENQKMNVYNKFSIKVNGKEYDAPITTATTQQIYPSPKFSFNPRLFLGAEGGVDINHVQGAFTPDLTLQLFSYGKYKSQPDLSILQVGAGYNTINKTPEAVIVPVAYNVGQHLPFMNNLYLAPSLQIGADGHLILGGGLHGAL